MAVNVKTPPIKLTSAYVTGEGVDDKYIVRAKFKQGSKEDKLIKKWLKGIWEDMGIDIEDYDNNVYRELMIPDPDSKRNKKNKKVKDWIGTGENVLTIKCGTKYPNGEKASVGVFALRSSQWVKINDELEENELYIGEGTEAIIYCKVATYEVDGNEGVTAYLSKVQLTKPKIVEGEGGVDEDVEGEEYDPALGGSKKSKKKGKKKDKKKGKKSKK